MLEGKFEEAKKAFDVVIQKYPECNYASKAQTYLDRIENMKN
jgi:outer membrane protein assembly factor BamD (BamD/ComL family)